METPVELTLIRNSERTKFRRCRQAWYWSYLLRYASKRRGGALEFGDLVHQSLGGGPLTKQLGIKPWYKPGKRRGQHPAKTFLAIYNEVSKNFDQWDDEGNRIPADELGVAMLEGYVDHYGRHDSIEVLAPEERGAIHVYSKGGVYLCTYVFAFDGVYRNLETGRVGLLEHKTAKSIQTVRINSGYGEQSLAYTWAAVMWLRNKGWLGENEILDMVLFNFLRKALPDERPENEQGQKLNQNGTVSKRQPSPLFRRQEMIVEEHNLEMIGERIRMEAWEMMRVREGKMPVYKNPHKDCDWDCEFQDVCEIHEMGEDYQSVLDLEFTSWDPYGDYREVVKSER